MKYVLNFDHGILKYWKHKSTSCMHKSPFGLYHFLIKSSAIKKLMKKRPARKKMLAWLCVMFEFSLMFSVSLLTLADPSLQYDTRSALEEDR